MLTSAPRSGSRTERRKFIWAAWGGEGLRLELSKNALEVALGYNVHLSEHGVARKVLELAGRDIVHDDHLMAASEQVLS